MIEIREFQDYFFCLKTWRVFRRTGAKAKALSPTTKVRTETAYVLYRNGHPHTVKLADILRKCRKEILEFLADTKTGSAEV